MRSRFDVCMRHFDSDAFAELRDGAWFDRQVAALPWRWQDAIKREWTGAWAPMEHLRREANLKVLHAVRQLADAQRAGLRPDASDIDLKARADVFARHYRDGIDARHGQRAAQWALSNLQRHGLAEFWPAGDHLDAQLGRLKCVRFWRRVLRGVFAKTVEQCAIGLGLVHKGAECYVSEQSVQRHRGQIQSAQRVLEQTYLENEFGQQVAVADLAAKGTGNKELRLAELMTRISGMDLIAQEAGHDGIFVTVTCPSRMHKWAATATGAVRPNPRYDGTTPRQAQDYLCEQWNKLGAWLGRRGVERYGFRVVEPHHDGCPHWHLLLFYRGATASGGSARAAMREGFKRYFLDNDSATERGADKHRVKFMPINRAKGSAAAYIAKYISKNTTGFAMDVDLYGNPIVSSVQRVQAWASTWRVRQFQQIGGAPVGVWRELRRINPQALEGAPLPVALVDALKGVNIGQLGGRVAVGYQAYTMAQGGPCVSRKHQTLRLLRQESGELNRYGEVRAKDVIGVEAVGWNLYWRADMVAMLGKLAPEMKRPARAQIETERCQWRGVSRAQVRPEQDRQARAEGSRPWTRVNNSTLTHWTDGSTGRDVALVSRSKTGNFRGWRGSTEGKNDEQSRSSA